MSESEKQLELLKLFELGEGAVAGERMMRWAEAFEDWMEERRSKFSRNVGGESHAAWREFLAFTGRPPWEADVPDLEAYIEALRKRKLWPATIKVRLAGLTKFYEYCQTHQIDRECEGGFNPVAGARRPKVRDYEKANYLSRKDEAELLEVIRQDPSPMGKRDFALFLMLLRTGWRVGEVRMLSWGSLGAGEHGSGALPEEVWQAVQESLQATGRWETIQPEEYVFAPSAEPLRWEAGGMQRIGMAASRCLRARCLNC